MCSSFKHQNNTFTIWLFLKNFIQTLHLVSWVLELIIRFKKAIKVEDKLKKAFNKSALSFYKNFQPQFSLSFNILKFSHVSLEYFKIIKGLISPEKQKEYLQVPVDVLLVIKQSKT